MELAIPLALDVYEEFDEIPAAVDEFPDDGNEDITVGMWMLFHSLSNKLGYDSFEEAEMSTLILSTALGNIARGWGIEEMEQMTEKDHIRNRRYSSKDQAAA